MDEISYTELRAKLVPGGNESITQLQERVVLFTHQNITPHPVCGGVGGGVTGNERIFYKPH